jgi:hypothetical protein
LVIKLKTTLPLLPLNYAFVVAAKTRIQRRLAIADEILQYRTGGNLTIFDKDHDLRRKADREGSSIRLRYNYYIQLVAIKRDWMRTKFEISPSGHASNLAWLPLIVYSNCSEAVCLAARTLLWRTGSSFGKRTVSTLDGALD